MRQIQGGRDSVVVVECSTAVVVVGELCGELILIDGDGAV
jgi:hypothetical protein